MSTALNAAFAIALSPPCSTARAASDVLLSILRTAAPNLKMKSLACWQKP
jgi:hypothetical protein